MLATPPLSLYVHFPWCIRKCPYCDFNSHTLINALPESDYIDALLKDLDHDLSQISNRNLVSIYCGGGTPSLFSAESIAYFLTEVKKRFILLPETEISLEANPGTVNAEQFSGYYAAGINRLSLGVQSFNDQALKRLGRIHNAKGAIEAIAAIKKAGFKNFNIDLMHGLPHQTLKEGLEDLNAALQYMPTHLSWYQLTLEPHTEFARKPPVLPMDELIWDLQDQGIENLRQAGFVQYEISALSQSAFECQHNQNYWTFGDYIGIGAGAHGKRTDTQKQTITRVWKKKHPKDYLSSQDSYIGGCESIQPSQLPFEFMLNALRCYQVIDSDLFEKRTGLPYTTLTRSLEKASEKELVHWDAHKIIPTDLGRRFYSDLVGLFL